MGKSTKSYVYQYNQKGPPEWRWVILAISLKKWLVSLINFLQWIYFEYSLVPGAKFDSAGVLV